MAKILSSLVLFLFTFFSPQNKINPNNLTGLYDRDKNKAIFNGREVSVPSNLAEEKKEKDNVLGENDDQKIIYIDLAKQRLYGYENEKKVYDFPISSGKWGRTPTGRFRIWSKLRYTLMTGGSQALGTYYYLPNVPYTMFFYNDEISKWDGFGIHGTYWHNNFGQPMSHGCINMKNEDVEQIYYWSRPKTRGNNIMYSSGENPGTEILIFGEAPVY